MISAKHVVKQWHLSNFAEAMFVANTEGRETIHFYSLFHDSQETGCINTINIIFNYIYNIYEFGTSFAPYPEQFCNLQQNSRPGPVWLYTANSSKKITSMILHMLSTLLR